MLEDVRERFLDDPVCRELQRGGERPRLAVEPYGHRRSGLAYVRGERFEPFEAGRR